MAQYINQDQYLTEFTLHKKYASSELLLDLVWTHSHIVMEIALSLYDSGLFDTSQLDRNLVIKAGLLFEIGVYQCGGFEWMPGQLPYDKPYIQHSLVGAEILRQEGFREDIVRVALTHEGVGLTPEDIAQFGLQLPPGDYLPTCPLEWLIVYSAKYHSKAPKFKTVQDIEAALSRYGGDKLERFRQLASSFGIPNIEAFEQKYADWHRSFLYRVKQIQEGSVQGSVITLPELNPAGIATQPPEIKTRMVLPAGQS